MSAVEHCWFPSSYFLPRCKVSHLASPLLFLEHANLSFILFASDNVALYRTNDLE